MYGTGVIKARWQIDVLLHVDELFLIKTVMACYLSAQLATCWTGIIYGVCSTQHCYSIKSYSAIISLYLLRLFLVCHGAGLFLVLSNFYW